MPELDVSKAIPLAFLAAFGTLAITFAELLYVYWLRPRWHLRHVPRPHGATLLKGHSKVSRKEAPGVINLKWFRELGPVIQFDSNLSIVRLATIDEAAIHHVLVADPYNFPKPGLLRRFLGALTGEGILVVEGATHQRQRRIMNPSFGAPHMKTMFPLFIDKALHLRDLLLSIMSNSEASPTHFDMYDYASRATLDVISAAGFGHEAEATDLGNESVLYQSFNRLFGTLSAPGPWVTLVRIFPFLAVIPDNSPRSKARRHAHDVIHRLGTDLLREKKAAIISSSKEGKVAASNLAGRDLLSTLIRANMAGDLTPQQKMSDTEVMAQISTFLLAGNDTTANAICWALYGLCTNPSTQNRLREEVTAVHSEFPTFDELNSLPYLDAVMRETLRVYAPVPSTSRIAAKDSIIPLSKPFVDTKGISHHEIFVAKNTFIFIPILASNCNPDVWGPDATKFRPERWIDDEGISKLPDGARDMPSVTFPTFLAGPRACIGFRFALIEMKTILFSLIRTMEFTLAVPADDIRAESTVVMRPVVKSQLHAGWQLPLLAKPVEVSSS